MKYFCVTSNNGPDGKAEVVHLEHDREFVELGKSYFDDHQLSLTYNTPEDGSTYLIIIPTTVFEVGYNNKYFIAKRHPYNFSQPPNTEITNYYILQIKSEFNFRTMDGLIGPLTLEQYQLKRLELGIPDSLMFSREYENLK